MMYFYIYAFTGFLFCFIARTKEGSMIVRYPLWVPIMMVAWLPIVVYLCTNKYTTITYKGKVIWTRKKK